MTQTKFRLVRYEIGHSGEYLVGWDPNSGNPQFGRDVQRAEKLSDDQQDLDNVWANMRNLYNNYLIKCIPEAVK